MRRTWVRLLMPPLLTAGLVIGVHLAWSEALGWLEPVVSGVIAAACVAVSSYWAARAAGADNRRSLLHLTEQIRSWRDNPSQSSSTIGAVLAADVRPVLEPLRELVTGYRQALADYVAAQETMETLRLFQERVGLEKGYSLSFVAGKNGVSRSGRHLVARLAPNLHWVAATPALQQLLGCALNDLAARPFLEFVHAEDVETLRRAFQDALRDGEAHNVTFRVSVREADPSSSTTPTPKPPQVRFLQMDLVTRYTNEGEPLHLRCHFVDVTERIRTDRELHARSKALQEANERLRQINADLQRLKEGYRDLYHNAPVLYFSLDPRGRFITCNDTMNASLGFSREELPGQPYKKVVAAGQPPQTGEFRDARDFETRWVKKDGTVIDVWIHTSPVLDEEGRFVKTRSVAQDVTERNRLTGELLAKKLELEQANERLERINQELDQFTYVVSHDLKEPLRTLEAFSTFLASDYGQQLGEDGQGYIDHLVQASRRLGRLIDDLLRLSRVGRVLDTPRSFDVREPVKTALSDLTARIASSGAVVRLDESLASCPPLWGDPQRVADLFGNLIGNGLKYNHSERPEVVIGVEGVDSPSPLHPPPVTLFVRDNGIGIAPEYHEQIFGIFRRLHRREEYEGTGAGLAICKKIVEAHGGRIWVESHPGVGATFFFTLPRRPEDRVAEGRDDGLKKQQTQPPASAAVPAAVQGVP